MTEKDKDISPDGSPYQWSAHPPEQRPKDWQPAHPGEDAPSLTTDSPQPSPSAAAEAERIAKEADQANAAAEAEKQDDEEKRKAAEAEASRASYRTRASRAKGADE